ALGIVLLLLTPRLTQSTLDKIEERPWPSLAVGVLTAMLAPLAALLIFGVGLAVGGWWIALIVLALVAVATAIGLAFGASFIGRWMLARAGRVALHPIWSVVLGAAILFLVGAVPIL